ncbi:hypothetical protein GF366_02230 [Candidatus Peregrinibacteria bacterium]|nr:hypothetical protein [Candidatus Peregrinibacteria bacterium]
MKKISSIKNIALLTMFSILFLTIAATANAEETTVTPIDETNNEELPPEEEAYAEENLPPEEEPYAEEIPPEEQPLEEIITEEPQEEQPQTEDSTNNQQIDCIEIYYDIENYNRILDEITNDPMTTDTRDKLINEQYELKEKIESAESQCGIIFEENINYPETSTEVFIPYEKDKVSVIVDELFPDVLPEATEAQAVYFLQNLGIIDGYPDGTYKPENEVNRVEALKIIFATASLLKPEYSIDTSNTNQEIDFSDTQKGEWYVPFVYVAKNAGIVDGYPDGTFKPGNPVNKVEFLKMLFEAFGIDINDIEIGEIPYSDVSDNDWFTPYVSFASELNLIDKENLLYPDQNLSRGAVSEITHKLLKSYDSRYLDMGISEQVENESLYCVGNVCFSYTTYGASGCKPIGEKQVTKYSEDFEFLKKITVELKDGTIITIDGNTEVTYDNGGKGKLGDSGSYYAKLAIMGEIHGRNKFITDISKIKLLIEITSEYRNATIECQKTDSGSEWVTLEEDEGKSSREVEKIINLEDKSEIDWKELQNLILEAKTEDLEKLLHSVKRSPKDECSPVGKKETIPGKENTFVYVDKIEITMNDDIYVKLDSSQSVWNHGKDEPMNDRALSVASTDQIVDHTEWYLDKIFPTNKDLDDVKEIKITFRKYVYEYPIERTCVKKSIVQNGETLSWNEWSENMGMEKKSEKKFTKIITLEESDKNKEFKDEMKEARSEVYGD